MQITTQLTVLIVNEFGLEWTLMGTIEWTLMGAIGM